MAHIVLRFHETAKIRLKTNGFNLLLEIFKADNYQPERFRIVHKSICFLQYFSSFVYTFYFMCH